jgi:RNA recognition motif-containing protein
MKAIIKTETKCDFGDRIKYINDDVLKTAPTGGNLEDVVIFNLGKSVTDDELEKEYEQRGLIPATIECLNHFDRSNGKKMDKMKYVGTHWKDAKGNWCYATFHCWNGERGVDVNRDGDLGWHAYWWFAGVRKLSTGISDTKPSSDTLTLELAIKLCKKNGLKVIREY